jgi:hypothetical protein
VSSHYWLDTTKYVGGQRALILPTDKPLGILD